MRSPGNEKAAVREHGGPDFDAHFPGEGERAKLNPSSSSDQREAAREHFLRARFLRDCAVLEHGETARRHMAAAARHFRLATQAIQGAS